MIVSAFQRLSWATVVVLLVQRAGVGRRADVEGGRGVGRRAEGGWGGGSGRRGGGWGEAAADTSVVEIGSA